jgi:hypothetical protein
MPNRYFRPLKAWSVVKPIVALIQECQTAKQKLRRDARNDWLCTMPSNPLPEK